MADPVSSIGSALQATLTGDLLKTLSAALASGSVTDSPPSIQNTQTPLSISGTLQSQLQNGGGAVLQTAAGPVTLSFTQPPQQPLPQGTLTLLIQPGNPPTASVVANQAVTPQAQIQTQATAAQQTQDVQTQPLQALPPLTVGQVLTATPLPVAAAPTTGPAAPVPNALPTPIVSQAAAGAAAASAIEAELPIAVLLNSAIPPAPASPSARFVTPQAFVVAAVEAAPEEEAIAGQGSQPQTQAQATTQQTQSPLTALPQAGDDDLEQVASGQPNILAAQESQNDSSAPQAPAPQAAPAQAAPLTYNPGATVPSAPPKAQDYLVVSIETPDGHQTAQANAAPQSQTMTATVMAQTGSGQPVLSTSEGPLLVSQPVSTTIGSELVLQRLTPEQAAQQLQTPGAQISTPQTQAATPAGPAPLNDVPLSIARQQPWPALTQLLGTLATASPAAAAFIRQAIPTVAMNNFAQAFASFVTEKSTPTPGTLPPPGALTVSLQGQVTSAPQDLKSALLQMGADLTSSALKSNPAQAQAQPWQSYQVPLLTDYGISMAQLFMRAQVDQVDDEPGKRAKAASTRFLIEVSPSQLGPVQLDGLLRKTASDTMRLDLIVRTEFAVPSGPGAEMADLFQNALGATGIVGGLSFQTGAETFVLPESDAQYSGKI